MAPTPRAALLIGIGALAALLVPPGLAALGVVAVIAATVADAALVRRAPVMTRSAPEVLSRGVAEALALDARSRFAGSIRVRQATPPDLDLSPAEGAPPLTGELTALRRGRHLLPAAAARSEGPLGLGAWYHRGAGEAEVRVYPDLPAARRVALAVRRSRFREQGLRGRGPLGLGTEFELVRDYSPDDDIRQVNWLATARLDRPMSNDFRVERDRDVIAVIDAGRLMSAPVADATRLDVALDALATLAAVVDELGDRFGALVFDAEVRTRITPRRGGGALTVNALYDAEPSELDSDYVRAFQRVGSSKRAFVVVFTDLLEEVAARSLIDGVPVLARRHAVAVATVADPDLEAAVEQVPTQPLDAYRAAIAVDVLEARRRVGVRLAHAGAQLVEAPPGELGAACVRAYLRAKSRARL